MRKSSAQRRDDDFLNERSRAEDVLLGSLGFGEEARIVSVNRTEQGYRGCGAWADGDTFEFESTDGFDDLIEWALGVINPKKK